ncbi:hypothetical protein P170DRAFT_400102, partial [Aspergillus steynii IBT 23096]
MLVVTTICALYALWAVVFADSLFNRLWSLSFCSLLLLVNHVFSLPFSLQAIIFYVLAFFNVLLCLALSPLLALLRRKSPPENSANRIQLLSEGKGPFIADIFLVHGLGSNPETTWKSDPENGVSWVLDLCKDLSDCRVFAFNHNSRWSDNTLSKSLRDHGDDLFRSLGPWRNSEEEQRRPIIFIGHSFGGLVIKQAVVLAKEDGRYEQTFTETPKYIFMGTPHKGSSLSRFGMLVSSFRYWEGSSTNLLETLKPGSMVNSRLNEAFLSSLKEGCRRDNTLCCFETVRETLFGFPLIPVVEEHSAVIDGAMKIGFERGHRRMQRLKKEGDDYNDIVFWIKERVKPFRTRQTELAREKKTKKEKRHKELYRSLTFQRMNTRVIKIEPSLDKTCTWLLGKEDYESWLKKDRGLLWIKGKPGSGKSTLMKWALKNHPADEDNKIVASFFFDGRGEHLQKSLEGSYRHLLVQIADQNMGVLEKLSANYEKYRNMHNDYGQGCIWEEKELQGLLSEAILSASRESHVWIYVDALDECGETAARSLLFFFQSLISPLDLEGPGHRISICFSCRHYPALHYEHGDEITMEKNNGLDIGAYVEKKLEGRHFEKDLIAEVKPEIISKAQGVFQWVRIVVEIIMATASKATPRQRVIEQIRSLPGEISDLYNKVLLEPEDAVDSLRLMKWVCFALRPLSLAELRFALILDAAPACTSLAECQNHMDFVETDSQMKQRVNYLSRGLAEVQDQEEQRVVRFIHQTVNDYLLDQGLQELESLSKGEESKAVSAGLKKERIAKGHRQILSSCIRYIFMPELLSLAESLSPEFLPSTQKLDTEFQFLRYSIKYWVSHASLVEDGKVEQIDLRKFFQWPSKMMVEAYMALWRWTFSDYRAGFLMIPGSSLFHIAAQYNLLSVAECIIETDSSEVNILNDRFQTPLHKASARGCTKISRILLENGALADCRDTDGWTPLQLATLLDHNEIA